MAFKRHNASWTAVYRDSDSAYLGTSPLRANGGYTAYQGYNTSAILADIKSSKVKAKVHLRYTVTDGGSFSLGMHKETTNKASVGRPYFNFTQKSYTSDTGSRSQDITTFPTLSGYTTFRDAIEKGGFRGPVLYGSGGLMQFSSMYIEVEGVWNEPPTKPKLAYPVGGETLSGSTTFRTGPSTDPEGDQIRYEFSLKDGKTTYYFPSQTGLTLAVDLTKYAETSTAVAGVRSYDGQTHSAWDYSKVFTLRKNVAPTSPSLVEPIGGISRDRTKTISFRWNHNDQDRQSLFRLRWRVQGTTAWTTVTVVSTEEVYAIAPNSFPSGTIEWQVQTEDQGGLASPWSGSGLFLAAEKSDAPTIITPVNGATVPSESLTVSWSSSGQIEYDVELVEGTSLLWKETRASGNKAVSIGVALSNNLAYRIRVRVRGNNGLWSDWAEASFVTSFTPPPQPELSISADTEKASIYIAIHNPLAAENEPDVLYNELFRREPNGEWIRLATNIPTDSGFTDFTAAGNTAYEYYATAMGTNRTTMDSIAVMGSVEVNYVILSLANDPMTFIVLDKVKPQSISSDFDMTSIRFAGRQSPITEFGEMIEDILSLDLLIEFEKLAALRKILASKRTVLYRDEQGDKRFVTISGMNSNYRTAEYYGVQCSLYSVDYKEGV